MTIWDVESRVLLTTIRVPSSLQVEFARNGTRIIASGVEAETGWTVTIVNLDTESLERVTCDIVGRTLLPSERARFVGGEVNGSTACVPEAIRRRR